MADIVYYRHRAAQEIKAAERSICMEARRIHEAMASRYAMLADRGPQPIRA